MKFVGFSFWASRLDTGSKKGHPALPGGCWRSGRLRSAQAKQAPRLERVFVPLVVPPFQEAVPSENFAACFVGYVCFCSVVFVSVNFWRCKRGALRIGARASSERHIVIENAHRTTRAEACGRLRGRDLFAEGLRKLCG